MKSFNPNLIMASTKQNLDERVSVLENAMINLAKTVDEGFAQQQRTSKAFWDQLKSMDNDRKPNYAVWIATGMLLISLFSGLYVLIGLRIDGSVTPIQLSLQEVETQFDASAQLRNIQFSDQQRKNAELQNALHDLHAELPEYPQGPTYFPNVSKHGKYLE